MVSIIGPLAWLACVNCDVGRAKRSHILMKDEMYASDTVDVSYEITSIDVTWRSANGRAFAKACGPDGDIMGFHMWRPAAHAVLPKFISVVQCRVAVWAKDAHVDGRVGTASYVPGQCLARTATTQELEVWRTAIDCLVLDGPVNTQFSIGYLNAAADAVVVQAAGLLAACICVVSRPPPRRCSTGERPVAEHQRKLVVNDTKTLLAVKFEWLRLCRRLCCGSCRGLASRPANCLARGVGIASSPRSVVTSTPML